MSETGTRLTLHDADLIAANVQAAILGESIVAGSVRRRRPEVGDIEMLVHRHAAVRLSVREGLYPGEWESVKGGGLDWSYWQLQHANGYKLDLFRFDDNNRGSILLIRTGPWQFSKQFVIALRRRGFRHEGGYVKNDRGIVPCPDEATAFRLAGMPFVAQQDRR